MALAYNQPNRRRYNVAIKLNHLIVPAKDKVASAQLFAEIFGLEVKPAQGRFAQVPIDEYLTIDFADDEHTGRSSTLCRNSWRAIITLFTSRRKSSMGSWHG
jgi:hypothetical protein